MKEAAELKWDYRAEFVENILDLQPGVLTVIIGTIFKEQKKKPCVLSNLTGVISETGGVDPVQLARGKARGQYVSEDDTCILEDSSGRISIRESEPHFVIAEQITGSIVALLGKADAAGYFNVQDTCVAGVPFKPELPAGVDLTVERKLGAKAEGRKFIALASGFNLGGYGDAKEC